jgi:hypothetical protein
MPSASTGPQSLAQTLTSLPQELQRVGEGALRSGALQISLVLFDPVCLKGRSDLVGHLERLIDGPFPSDVVHHAAIIPRARLPLLTGAERPQQRCPHHAAERAQHAPDDLAKDMCRRR